MELVDAGGAARAASRTHISAIRPRNSLIFSLFLHLSILCSCLSLRHRQKTQILLLAKLIDPLVNQRELLILALLSCRLIFLIVVLLDILCRHLDIRRLLRILEHNVRKSDLLCLV